MEYYDIRHQVLSAIQEAVSLGLIHGTSGNIAVRDPASGNIAITPSGIAYATMTEEDIAIVNPDGKWLEGKFKPSSETPMHTSFRLSIRFPHMLQQICRKRKPLHKKFPWELCRSFFIFHWLFCAKYV